jgi:hypothetical protein
MNSRLPTRRATSDWSLSSPPADHAVHVVADQVDDAVTDPQVQLDVGIAGMKVRQVRNDEQLRHRGAHVHAQPAARVGARVRHAGLDIVQIGEQAHGAVVVGSAVGRHRHAACGAVEQLHAQALLQRLHMLGHGGLGQVERIRRPGERAGLHHPHEYAHGLYLVHGFSLNLSGSTHQWVLKNSHTAFAG